MVQTLPDDSPLKPLMLENSKDERFIVDWITTLLKAAPTLHPSCICADLLAVSLRNLKMDMLPISDFLKPRGTTLRGYGDLLDSAVTFANSTWSAEEQAKFARCTRACDKIGDIDNPGADYRKEFKRIRGSEHTALQEVTIQVFGLLADVCINFKRDRGGAPKLEKKRASKWPSSPSKFIPRGASAAVAAFLAWARSARHIIPIFTLSELTFICPSLKPAMIEDKTLLGLVEELFRHHLAWLQRTVSLPTLSEDHTLCAIDDINMYYAVFADDWFQDRMTNPGFVKSNAQTFTSLYHTLATYRPLLDKASFYKGEKHENFAMTFGLVGLTIQQVMLEVSQPLPNYPAFQSAPLSFSKWPLRLNSLVQNLTSSRGRPGCAGDSCSRTGEETKTNLSMCAGCQTVRYCSKECQRSDWKDHKHVCKLLKALLPIVLAYGTSDLEDAKVSRRLQGDLKQTGLKEEDFSLVESYLQKRNPKYKRIESSRSISQMWSFFSPLAYTFTLSLSRMPMQISPDRCLSTLSKSEHLREQNRVVDVITPILKEAPTMNPSSCPCVDVFATLLYKLRMLMLCKSDMVNGKPIGTTLRGYGDFLESAVAFANSTWSTEQQAKFARCTQGCEKDGYPDRPIKEYQQQYKQIRGPEHTPFQQSIILIFDLLSDACGNIKHDHKTVLKLERKSRSSKWPSSPSNFIPQGSSAAVAAFSAWARLAGHIVPVFVLSELTFICPSIRLSMAEDTALLGLVEELFLRHVTWLQKSINFAMPNGRDHHTICAVNDIEMYLGIFVGDWFRDRVANPDFVRSNQRTFTSLYHTLAGYRSLLEKASFYESNRREASSVTFGIVALGIQEVMSETSQPLPSYPILESARHALPHLPVNIYMLLQRVISIRGRPECAGESCNRTGEQTKTNLSICGQCQTVRYCSKECQTSDWKNHKPVCKALKRIRPIALTYGMLNLTRGEAMDQLLDECVRAGVRKEDMLLVGQYIEKHDHKYRRSLPSYPKSGS